MWLLLGPGIYLISTIIAFGFGRHQQAVVNRYCQFAALAVLVISVCIIFIAPMGTEVLLHITRYDQVTLVLDFRLDTLSWTMLCLTSFISLMIQSYSTRYLFSDQNQNRFMAQLCMLSAAVMLLAASNNLFTAFIAWQFIGLCLYLLLNHYHYTLNANRAAKKKFMINRLGDISFLLAVVYMLTVYGDTHFYHLAHVSWTNNCILLLVFVAVMTKSAQFPFHIWLIDTMETPTPVSAMMHAGVINAGGVILAKLSAYYVLFSPVMISIASIGFVTAILGHWFMQKQADVKKRLAYSTMGQMGFMIMQCGLGCFSSAVLHLIAHGLLKSSLFLNAGSSLRQTTLPIKTPKSQVSQHIISIGLAAITVYIGTHGMSPSVLWFFMGYTLYQLYLHCLNKAGSTALKVLTIAFIVIAYLVYMHILCVWFKSSSDAIVENHFSPSEKLAWAFLLLLSLLTLAYKYLAGIKQAMHWLQNHKLGIEPLYRQYLINPLRYCGDTLLRLQNDNQAIFYALIVVIVLASMLFGYLHFTYDNSSGGLVLTAINSTLMLLMTVMANRVDRLRTLSLTIIISSLAISNIAFLSGEHEMLPVGVYHLANSGLIIFTILLLLKQRLRGKRIADIAKQNNRLPWSHFYLATFLLLFIGIPGTSSFIIELYLLKHLLLTHWIMALTVGAYLLLISLVILHTLQVFFFNPNAIKRYATKVPVSLHCMCWLVILINVYSGIQPDKVLHLLAKTMGA